MLDVASILKDIRATKILLEHGFLSQEVKKRIDHTEVNLIDLEEELSDSQSQDEYELSSEHNMTTNVNDTTAKTQDKLLANKSAELLKINADILKSLSTNIIKRPKLRAKKRLEFASFLAMNEQERKEIILKSIKERMMRRKASFTRESAALFITRWAKKWLRENKHRRGPPGQYR